jgi:predicted ATP-dependent serine protease
MYGEISSLSLPFRYKDRLLKSGYFTLSQISRVSPETLKQEIKIPLDSALSISKQANELLAALEYIISYKPKQYFLPTMIRHMDEFLAGGLRTAGLYEIAGPPCIGKTLLAMQICISAAQRGLDSLFIDTEGSFSRDRLIEIAEGKGISADEVLEKIHYVRVVSFIQLEDLIGRLEEYVSNQLPNCIAIVIDSLQIPLKEPDSNIFRSKLLPRFGLSLQQLAKSLNLVILATNKLTQIEKDLIPQFGDSWSSVLSLRISLSSDMNDIFASIEVPEGTVRIQLSLFKEGLDSRSQTIL